MGVDKGQGNEPRLRERLRSLLDEIDKLRRWPPMDKEFFNDLWEGSSGDFSQSLGTSMVIHIKDERTDRVVRALAEARGVSITAAVHDACEDVLDRTLRDERPLHERLKPLLDRLDRYPRTGLVADKQFFDDLWEAPHGDFSKTDIDKA
jgi:antitoxin VapB